MAKYDYEYRIRKHVYGNDVVRFTLEEREKFYVSKVSASEYIWVNIIRTIGFPVFYLAYMMEAEFRWYEYSSFETLAKAVTQKTELIKRRTNNSIVEQSVVDIWDEVDE